MNPSSDGSPRKNSNDEEQGAISYIKSLIHSQQSKKGECFALSFDASWTFRIEFKVYRSSTIRYSRLNFFIDIRTNDYVRAIRSRNSADVRTDR